MNDSLFIINLLTLLIVFENSNFDNNTQTAMDSILRKIPS